MLPPRVRACRGSLLPFRRQGGNFSIRGIHDQRRRRFSVDACRPDTSIEPELVVRAAHVLLWGTPIAVVPIVALHRASLELLRFLVGEKRFARKLRRALQGRQRPAIPDAL